MVAHSPFCLHKISLVLCSILEDMQLARIPQLSVTSRFILALKSGGLTSCAATGIHCMVGQTSWNVNSSGPSKASLRTKLVEAMEFQVIALGAWKNLNKLTYFSLSSCGPLFSAQMKTKALSFCRALVGTFKVRIILHYARLGI